MLYVPYPFKCCVKCGNEFLPTEAFFYRNGRFLRVECRACTKAYRDRTRADKEKINAYNRKRYHERREIESERKKRYRQNHPAEVREICRRSQQRHRETKRVNYQRRQSRKLELPTQFTPKDWQHALDYFDGCCAVCGRPPGLWHTLAMDHWIPLSSPNCPGTIPANIVPLCHGEGGCNNSKGSREPSEWLIDKLGKRKAKQVLDRIGSYVMHIVTQRIY